MSLLATSSLTSEISIGAGAMIHADHSERAYRLELGSPNSSTRDTYRDKKTGRIIYRYTLYRSSSTECVFQLKLADVSAVAQLELEFSKQPVDAHVNELKKLCSSVPGVYVLKDQGQRVRPNQATIIGKITQFYFRPEGPPRSDDHLDILLFKKSKRLYRVTVPNKKRDDMTKFLARDNSNWSIQKFEFLFFRVLHIAVPSIPCRSPVTLFAAYKYPEIKPFDVSVKWIIGVTLAVKNVLKLEPVVLQPPEPSWKNIEGELLSKKYPTFIVAFLMYFCITKNKSLTLCTKVFALFWAASFDLSNVLAIAMQVTGKWLTLRTIATRSYCESGEYPRFNFSISRKDWLKMTAIFQTMSTYRQTNVDLETIVKEFQKDHLVPNEGIYLMGGKLNVSPVKLPSRQTSQVSKFDNNKKAEILTALEPRNILDFVLDAENTDHLLGAAFTILTHVWPLRANTVVSLPDWCLLSVFNVALKHPSALYPMLYINTKLQDKNSDPGKFIVVGTIGHTSLLVLMHCYEKIMRASQRNNSAAKLFDCNHSRRRTLTKRFMQAFLGSKMEEAEICRLVNFNKAARALFTSENCKRVINEALSKSDSKKQKKEGGASEEHSLGIARSNYTSWSIKTQEAVRKRILECRETLKSVKKCPDYIRDTGFLDLDSQAERSRFLFNEMFGEDLSNKALGNWAEDGERGLWQTRE
jgi:hypothetical protein